MRMLFGSAIVAAVAGWTGVAFAGAPSSLRLDFQPPGGTTAPGFEAFESANQVLPLPAGTDYSAFGTTINVALGTANLPDGRFDFQAVTRNGAADEVENDWLGVDTRTDGVDVELSVMVLGLPAGFYSWLSGHHDGGTNPGQSNGDFDGLADVMIVDATGTTSIPNGVAFSRENRDDPRSTFAATIRSDGSPVSFAMAMDNQQGGESDTNSLFAFINSLQITTTIPEPTSLVLLGVGFASLAFARRRTC